MKIQNTKMLAAAALITLFVMAGCAGKDDMGMDDMNKKTMSTEMKTESPMGAMDSTMDDMSHKKMESDMKKMPEKIESEMAEKMDTMKTEMDETMGNEMKTME